MKSKILILLSNLKKQLALLFRLKNLNIIYFDNYQNLNIFKIKISNFSKFNTNNLSYDILNDNRGGR
ncbi:hypothetical protein BpHYR1_026750 [Brachionus plicatilis]|uniref:Uncharacterized protein n=1 Tax=Brachionus plicatilis TaxID=10195 RepID=A0A3M7R1J0_BRAPC|nr:hypothetical protein BpHYR1_026750 [Brachionus plicatilis]